MGCCGANDITERPRDPPRDHHTPRNLRLPRKAPLRLALRVIRIAALGNTEDDSAIKSGPDEVAAVPAWVCWHMMLT